MITLPQKVLAVDNDPGILRSVSTMLTKHNVKVVEARDWQSALYLFNTQRFEAAIAALRLDELNGAALIQKWRHHDSIEKRAICVIAGTGQDFSKGDEALLKELGDVSPVPRPYNEAKLITALATTLEKSKITEKVAEVATEKIEPLMRHGKIDKAMEVAKAELELLKDKGKFLSAKVHIEGKDYAHALQLLKEAQAADPNNMSYLNEMGRLMLAQGRLEEAQALFEKADAAAPMNIQRITQMAALYLETDNPDKSVNKMSQLIDLNPDSPDLKFQLFEQLVEAGYKDHARQLSKETSTPGELIKHYNNKGVLHSKQSQYQDALEEYYRAVEMLPNSSLLYRIQYNMAIAHINLKDQENLKAARKILQDILKVKPGFTKAQEKLDLIAKYIKD